jgi:hypothetical protein
MKKINLDALKRFASKYIWWKTPDEAITTTDRAIAQVMNIGDHEKKLTLKGGECLAVKINDKLNAITR